MLSFLRQDIKYYTLRQSMTAGTMASAVYQSTQSVRRKAMLAGVAGLYLMRRVPLWMSALGHYRALGGSVWARLERCGPRATDLVGNAIKPERHSRSAA